MGADSKIEWCDATFNPWRGCTKVSPGCANCYAETLSKRNPKLLGEWGKGKPRVLASDKMWKEPLKWNEAASICDACGLAHWSPSGPCMAFGCDCETRHRARVFCASLGDWLDDEVPIQWLARLLDLIRRTPNLDWLLLTKRPQNWLGRVRAAFGWVVAHDVKRSAENAALMNWLSAWIGTEHCEEPGTPGVGPANVWIGTTVEDQTRANERIPHLLRIPARVRFLSVEPMLGPVDLGVIGFDEELNRFDCITPGRNTCGCGQCAFCAKSASCPVIDWVICGGESGPGARPMHPDWARSLRDQCTTAGVPFLFKQHGDWVGGQEDDVTRWRFQDGKLIDPHAFPDFNDPEDSKGWAFDLETATVFRRVGKKAAGRLLDGRTHDEFPRVESEVEG